MKNVWIFILFAAGLSFLIGGVHLWIASAKTMSILLENFDTGDTETVFMMSDTANMRRTGMIFLGLALLIFHQAIKYHLDTK